MWMGGAKKLSGRETQRNTVQASPLKDAYELSKMGTRFRYKDTVTLFGLSETQVTCRTLSSMLRRKIIEIKEQNEKQIINLEGRV
jgi:hypothetical protein